VSQSVFHTGVNYSHIIICLSDHACNCNGSIYSNGDAATGMKIAQRDWSVGMRTEAARYLAAQAYLRKTMNIASTPLRYQPKTLWHGEGNRETSWISAREIGE